MQKKFLFLCGVSWIGVVSALAQDAERYQVLLFTKSVSYPHRHDSIAEGVQMFRDLSEKHRFGLTWTADDAIFDDTERLGRMDVVVFLNTSGDVLNKKQKESFQRYIRNGGNFVGIHSASFTMMDWPWYVNLLGGVWDHHPGRHTAVVKVVDHIHPSTAHLPPAWIVTDEWFNFRELSSNIKVLLTVDEKTYPGGKMPEHHPIAWRQDNFEGARSFYTLLGHTREMYADPWFRQHITGALWWAATGIELEADHPVPTPAAEEP